MYLSSRGLRGCGRSEYVSITQCGSELGGTWGFHLHPRPVPPPMEVYVPLDREKLCISQIILRSKVLHHHFLLNIASGSEANIFL